MILPGVETTTARLRLHGTRQAVLGVLGGCGLSVRRRPPWRIRYLYFPDTIDVIIEVRA